MKRGEITFTTIVKLILAIGVVLLLLLFSIRLISPIFERGDETAKSYMKTLKGQIDVADDGETGEFYMWYVDGREGEKDFYVVYFGNAIEAEILRPIVYQVAPATQYSAAIYGEKMVNVSFNSFGRNPNRICICYTAGNKNKGYDTFCDYCEDLSHPAVFTGKDLVEGTWVEEGGDRISIKLEGEKYVFAEIK